MKALIAIIISLIVYLPISAQAEDDSKPPQLVCFIHIDELHTEHLLNLRDKFGKYGFNQIIEKGTFFHRGNYNSSSSYKGTKLTNLYTGAYPDHHGLIGEAWFETLKEEEKHAFTFIAENPEHPDSGFIRFPKLQATTLSDELNLFYKGKSKIASVSLSAEDIAYQGYTDEKLSFWLDRSTGRMTSADTTELSWVEKYNSMQFADMYVERQWGPVTDLKKYHEYISEKEIKARHFMYDLQSENKNLPYKKLIGSPYGNVFLRDFVAALIINENLGKDQYPDLLSLHLSCKPFTKDKNEMFDAEVEDMLLRLDDQIASLIQLIKENVGLERTLLVFTSTPSNGWLPETLNQNKLHSGYFNGKKTAALLNLYLMAIYGQGKWVKGYNDRQFYFNHKLLEKNNIELEEVQKKAAKFLLEVSGIEKTITSYHIRVNEYTNGSYQEIQQNYYYGRSGDLFISLKPGWTEEKVSNSKRKVLFSQNIYAPVVFYGWKTKSMQIFDPINMINIAPTINSLLHIPEPNGCVGKPLNEILK